MRSGLDSAERGAGIAGPHRFMPCGSDWFWYVRDGSMALHAQTDRGLRSWPVAVFAPGEAVFGALPSAEDLRLLAVGDAAVRVQQASQTAAWMLAGCAETALFTNAMDVWVRRITAWIGGLRHDDDVDAVLLPPSGSAMLPDGACAVVPESDSRDVTTWWTLRRGHAVWNDIAVIGPGETVPLVGSAVLRAVGPCVVAGASSDALRRRGELADAFAAFQTALTMRMAIATLCHEAGPDGQDVTLVALGNVAMAATLAALPANADWWLDDAGRIRVREMDLWSLLRLALVARLAGRAVSIQGLSGVMARRWETISRLSGMEGEPSKLSFFEKKD